MVTDLDSEVWICGAGVVSALGLDINTMGERLENGESGIRPQHQFDAEVFSNSLAAEVQNFKANAYVKQRKNLKLMSRSVRLGMGAIRLARFNCLAAAGGEADRTRNRKMRTFPPGGAV